MASREELLNSIQPGMRLTKNFFMRVYGYELTWPGSAEVALTKLESVGCVKAREHYERIVGEYLEVHSKELKNAAEWYKKQLNRKEVKECKSEQEQLLERKKQLLLQRLRT